MIVKFFKPCGMKDKMFEIPEKLKQSGTKVRVMMLGVSIIGLAFSFLLTATNLAIEKKAILLGIFLFMLYKGKDIVTEALRMISSTEREKYEHIFSDETILRGSQIIGRVSNKVMKKDSNTGVYHVMSNEVALNCIQNYLTNLWEAKIIHKFQIFEMISVIIMLVAAVKTNVALPQGIFIPLLTVYHHFIFKFCISEFK